MKTFKYIDRPVMVIDTHKCDICGGQIEERVCYEVNRATIEVERGGDFPEGSCTQLKKIDCCADCMENKIIPLISKTFSVKFREYSPGFEDEY